MKRAISILSVFAVLVAVVLVVPGIALADHDFGTAGGARVNETYNVSCSSPTPGACHEVIYGGQPQVGGLSHPQPVYAGHGVPNLRVPGALIGGAIGSKSRRHPVQGAIIGGTAGYLGGMLIEMLILDAQTPRY